MPQVKLARAWFAPNAQYFDKGVQEIPDHLTEFLPSSAEVLAEPKPEPKAPVKKSDEK